MSTAHWSQTLERDRTAVRIGRRSGNRARLRVLAPPAAAAPDRAVPCVLSARTPQALAEQARRLLRHLADRPGTGLADLAYSLLTTRSHFEHRAVVLARNEDELTAGLRAVAQGEPAAHVVQAVTGAGNRPVFVFPGQGSQWQGMALGLMADPVFADHIHACDAALGRWVDWSLLDVLHGRPGAPGLDRVDVVQPALFAVMTSLAVLWQSHGVRPAAVIGHSQGEIAAAYVAGALDLPEAARIVALRSRALTALSGQGGMGSIALPADRVRALLNRRGGDLAVAAVNGPGAVVVSGDPAELDELLAECAAAGARTKRLPVDYASHSPHVERLRDRLAAELGPVVPRSADVPFHSTVTAGPLDTAGLDAGYWFENLRRPVRFAETVRGLVRAEYGPFIEVSPHPVLTAPMTEILGEEAASATAIGTLRRDADDQAEFITALAHAHTGGLPVDLVRALPPGGGAHGAHLRVELPTYAFQRRRHWREPAIPRADLTAAGLAETGHPLLGAAVELADEGGLVLTGGLTLEEHPWIADHTVLGHVLLPGTAFVEMLVQAGHRVGCGHVEDVTLHAPLLVAERERAQLQIQVSGPDESGRRRATVRSRVLDEEPGEWRLHAAGTLGKAADRKTPGPSLDAWPPPSAERLDQAALYPTLARLGLAYGPAFQGVRAVWRDGDVLYADVALPQGDAGFTVHPALLDAALHPYVLALPDEEPAAASVPCPYTFTDVTVHSTGAARLRVAIRPLGPDTFAVTVADDSGKPVADIGGLTLRRIDADRLAGLARRTSAPLHRLHWVPVEPAPAAGAGTVTVEVPRPDGEDVARDAHDIALRTLHQVRTWLARDDAGTGPLVVVTRGAVAVGDDEPVPGLAQSPVWGLLRTAQAEHPGRFVLVDLDEEDASRRVLPAAVATGEPQLAIRRGKVHVPRLTRVSAAGPAGRLNPDGTVLITGGTGVLGRLVARHLAAEHGVRHLLLAGRRGPEAAGAAELRAELAGLGATATIVACDVADPTALRALLEGVPDAHPLTAVVHAAGVLADATIESLDADRLAAVLRPKVDAAWHLHRLTERCDLAAFVLFSSSAGTFGPIGQGNYAAANTFLDALAQHRHARGLPATALAWGLWEEASGMTGHLGRADLARLARDGVLPLSTPQALACLDAALARPAATLVPVRLNPAALRAQSDAATVPPPLWSFLPARDTGPHDDPGDGGQVVPLADRLAGKDPAERHREILGLVAATAAAVLGRTDPDAVAAARSFADLGFDSLIGLQFRNRLGAATGLRLPATLVFDHPSPQAVARYIDAETAGSAEPPATALLARLDELEAALDGLDPDDDHSAAIATRLRALAARWDRTPSAAVREQIETATTEEILDLIDREFGDG